MVKKSKAGKITAKTAKRVVKNTRKVKRVKVRKVLELKRDQIFLILSNNPKTKDTQKLSIRNLFFSRSGGLLSVADVTKLWETLAKNNFIIHPALEAKHYQNKICIWCGGEITKLTGLEEENWEARCRSCGYLYDEQK